MLARIIRVTDEVVEYRKWIQQNFPPPMSPQDELNGELSSDSVPSDSTTLAYKSTKHSTKSYAKAVTMNSAQSKRLGKYFVRLQCFNILDRSVILRKVCEGVLF